MFGVAANLPTHPPRDPDLSTGSKLDKGTNEASQRGLSATVKTGQNDQ